MDKEVSRALALGGALFFLQNVPYHMNDLFKLCELFDDYIRYGQWPKEAAYGSEEGKERAKALLSTPRETRVQGWEEESKG